MGKRERENKMLEPLIIEDTLAPCAIPVSRIETPPFYEDIVDEIRQIMHSHSGDIQELKQADKLISYILIFPPGTIKREIYPRIHDSRYKIVFPDGFALSEHEAVNRKNSIVRFPLDTFSAKMQKKYFK